MGGCFVHGQSLLWGGGGRWWWWTFNQSQGEDEDTNRGGNEGRVAIEGNHVLLPNIYRKGGEGSDYLITQSFSLDPNHANEKASGIFHFGTQIASKKETNKKSSHEISLPQFRIEINFSLFFLELNPMTVYYPFGLDLLLLLLHLAWKFEKLSLRRKTKIREITGSVYGLSEFL